IHPLRIIVGKQNIDRFRSIRSQAKYVNEVSQDNVPSIEWVETLEMDNKVDTSFHQ
ncbi:hypothetical protein MTR_1949s0010, partial [Medicago truncatula]